MPLNLANKITFARILAVPIFITVILYYSPERDYFRLAALGVFLFAAISDVVDGYIARTRNQQTPAGAILDPLADKALLISAFVCLLVMGHELPTMRFPIWLVVAVISRDVMLLVGSAIIYLLHGQLDIKPSWWGKSATFLQIAAVVGLLLQWSWTSVVWPLAFLLTVVSGVDYARQGIAILNSPPRRLKTESDL